MRGRVERMLVTALGSVTRLGDYTVARICHLPQNSLHFPLIPLHSPLELGGVSGESGVTVLHSTLPQNSLHSPLIPLHSPLKHHRVLGESGVQHCHSTLPVSYTHLTLPTIYSV